MEQGIHAQRSGKEMKAVELFADPENGDGNARIDGVDFQAADLEAGQASRARNTPA